MPYGIRYKYLQIYLINATEEFLVYIELVTTKKSSCPSVFFPAFLQTVVIDKPIPALFVGALQSAAIGGL